MQCFRTAQLYFSELVNSFDIFAISEHCLFEEQLEILTEDKMAPVVRNLFEIRTQSYFEANIVSLGTLPTICEVLQKYDLFNYFDTWFSDSVFPTYLSWKAIVKTKIQEFEENAWIDFVQKHPSFKFARTCLDNVSPHKFWSISDQYLDLVCRLHVQIRLMGYFLV